MRPVAAPRPAAPQRARRRILGAATAWAALASAGCGFQLRGAARMPFRKLYLAAGSSLALELRRQLRASDIVFTPTAEGADAVLDLLLESREREILAFSSTGRAREYQLRLRVRFRLHDGQGTEWIAPSEIVLRRDVTVTDLQLTSRAEEEALLYRDMQTDAVQQLLRRLAAAKPAA